MYTIFNTPVVRSQCPDEITEQSCPLRDFINKGQNTFHVSVNESYLEPNTTDVSKIVKTLVECRKICNKCLENNKQK